MTPATPDTVPHRLIRRAAQSPHAPAYWRRNDAGWQPESWSRALERVRALSAGLIELGLEPGDRVAIMLPTSPEWEYCHLAALAAGGVVVGIDAHDAAENIRHVLATARPKGLCAASPEQLRWLEELMPGPARFSVLPDRLARLFESPPPLPGSWPCSRDAAEATIIFSSGSTGQPKGIAYTHGQLRLAADAIMEGFPSIDSRSRIACWLPLSNLFQRIIDVCAISRGAQTWFVERPVDIVDRLPEIRPALFIGVPRFYEKLHAGILAELAKRPGAARRLARLAWDTGIRYRQAQSGPRRPPSALRLAHWLADRFVLSRIRRVMGGEVEYLVSGSAPFPGWLLDRFEGLGWTVLEAYGISENIVPVAMSTPLQRRPGSVGLPLAPNELKVAHDGELLVRGPGVCSGYLGAPASESAVDPEGFLHTGDYGRIDDDGFVWITGRKSEVFKTSTGRRVAPAPIEAALKRLPYVEHAVVLGGGRPVPIALLSVDARQFRGAPGAQGPLLDSALHAVACDVASACADLPAHERPPAVLLTRRSFSVAGGDLTANLKLRRPAIEQRYRAEIAALYESLTARGHREQCLVREAH